MNIVFDMDNTLVDEFGATLRPKITELLDRLIKDGHILILWTNSRRMRANVILAEHLLNRFFRRFIYREDYDPYEKGICKDIREVEGDWLIDDDPQEINFVKSIKRNGFLIKSYRQNTKLDENEIEEIYHAIKKSNGFFKNFLRNFINVKI